MYSIYLYLIIIIIQSVLSVIGISIMCNHFNASDGVTSVDCNYTQCRRYTRVRVLPSRLDNCHIFRSNDRCLIAAGRLIKYGVRVTSALLATKPIVSYIVFNGNMQVEFNKRTEVITDKNYTINNTSYNCMSCPCFCTSNCMIRGHLYPRRYGGTVITLMPRKCELLKDVIDEWLYQCDVIFRYIFSVSDCTHHIMLLTSKLGRDRAWVDMKLRISNTSNCEITMS